MIIDVRRVGDCQTVEPARSTTTCHGCWDCPASRILTLERLDESRRCHPRSGQDSVPRRRRFPAHSSSATRRFVRARGLPAVSTLLQQLVYPDACTSGQTLRATGQGDSELVRIIAPARKDLARTGHDHRMVTDFVRGVGIYTYIIHVHICIYTNMIAYIQTFNS